MTGEWSTSPTHAHAPRSTAHADAHAHASRRRCARAYTPRMAHRMPGFRLGIYVFKDAEIVDFAAPHGVFSVARRFDPELDAFALVVDALMERAR